MNLTSYIDTTSETAVYPGNGEGFTPAITYVALGLAGETGELVELVKKLLRGDFGLLETADDYDGTDHTGVDHPEFRRRLIAEMGDVLWYWGRLCEEMEIDPDEVIAYNLSKLADRADRGVIRGSGNDR